MSTVASAGEPRASGRIARYVAKLATARPAVKPRAEIRPCEAAESLSIATSACAVIALVCAWVLLQTLVLGGLAEQRSQHLLYSRFRSELAQATAPTGALDYNNEPVVPGSPVALLTIPSLGLQQVIVDGTASGDLFAGPGHLRDTPLPGAAGTSVVLGRGSTYGAPFRHLTDLKPGDTISVVNAQGRVGYTVRDIRRAGDPEPPPPTGTTAGMLTLVSAQSGGFLSGFRTGAPVYIDATTRDALPDGAVATAVPSSELVMGRDTSSLPMLALLLGLLAALVMAVSVARRRFGAVLVWLVATPVVIGLAWSVTDQVMRLLPNLM